MSIVRKVETVTFRIDAVLKTAFAQIAAENPSLSANCCASSFATVSSGARAESSRPKRGGNRLKRPLPRRTRAATRLP